MRTGDPGDPDPASGSLGERDLLELLRFLHRTLATVQVVVEGPGVLGEIQLRQGGIRAAGIRSGGTAQTGAAALARLLVLPAAGYRLGPLPAGTPRNIQHETSFLLDSIARAVTDAELQRANRAAVSTATMPAFTPAPLPQAGERFGRCRLIREVGRGASAVAWLARHESLDLEVVVKVLVAPGGMHQRLMTSNEARLLARLTHPGIVRLYDFDDSARLPYLVMEHVDGEGLDAILRREGRLGPARVLPWFVQVAGALEYAVDEVGLVHGDLKPENLLISPAGAKLLDFGVARALDTAVPPLAGDVVVGSPSYISPEQVERAPFDHRADLYAFGASLYHALAGRPPFVDEDPVRLMVRRLHEAPIPLMEAVPGIEAKLSDLVQQLLARRPEDRPASHAEVAERLSEILVRRAETDGDLGNVIRRRTSFWLRMPGRVLRRG